MATINYNGMTLEEFISDEPLTFQPFKKMLTWEEGYSPNEHNVMFVNTRYKVVVFMYQDGEIGISEHCALLPDPPKPRRATNRELSRWLAQGNGECLGSQDDADTAWNYPMESSNVPLREGAKVRKWSDTEWHEPTVDYLFGGDNA